MNKIEQENKGVGRVAVPLPAADFPNCDTSGRTPTAVKQLTFIYEPICPAGIMPSQIPNSMYSFSFLAQTVSPAMNYGDSDANLVFQKDSTLVPVVSELFQAKKEREAVSTSELLVKYPTPWPIYMYI